MKRFLTPVLLALPLLLAACEDGSVRDTLGLAREAPDEFTVVSRPPLTVPPEFTLRPPRPGAPQRGTSAGEQARSLLTGTAEKPNATMDDLVEPTVKTGVTPVLESSTPSGAGASLLKRAGADGADENIRDQLGTDARTPADTSKATSLYEKMVGADKAEPVVDAKKEAERLRTNKDTGKPVTEGEVPEEKTGTDSVLDRFF